MRALVIVACIGTVGCAGTVSRRVIVTPDEAATLARTHVVHLKAPTDKLDGIVADVEYKVGEEIPGQGVVRAADDKTLWVTGIVMTVAGSAFLTGGVLWAAGDRNDSSSLCCGPSGGSIGGILMASGGGALALTGIALMAAGLPHAVVDKGVRVAPVAGRGYGGGTFELRF